MKISQSDYVAMLRRLDGGRHAQPQSNVENLAVREKDLHSEILDECRRRGWKAMHSRMDRPTTCGVGDPDFVIAADNGRTIWLEAKARRNKLTIAQAAVGAWLRKLGHEWYEVRSIDQVLTAFDRKS